ncbi:MAG: hypothetical protein ACUVXG_05525 [Anaerolineae bacterium]
MAPARGARSAGRLQGTSPQNLLVACGKDNRMWRFGPHPTLAA